PFSTAAVVPSDHEVESLPGLPEGAFSTRHYAGHIPVRDAESFTFYWLFESAGQPDSDPIVIWLNGGPGCSSMDGLWLENGPFRLDGQHHITVNPYRHDIPVLWHKKSNLLYVDQPLGTGLSFTTNKDYADNDLEVNDLFYEFLLKFMGLHPSFRSRVGSEEALYRSRPIFFAGESHAGHYIPSMVAHVLRKNKELMSGQVM
ncbi:unnamed protein product, partial [Discosporangium mesarthrocarpum]